jgi:membrane dipeptidase
MTRILTAALLTGLATACGPSDMAETIHEKVVTLDTHVDIPFDFATDDVDPLDADLQVNIQKMRSGGLDAAFFIVYVGQAERTPEDYALAKQDALTKFNAIHRMTDVLYPEEIGLAYSPSDVESLIDEGRLAAAIGIENGYVIGTDLELLDDYYARGARYMTLVHNGHNDIGDSAQPNERLGDNETEHGGLSEFGVAVVTRMNDLGMMVDVSHASKATALDAIAASRAPVIASHSSVRAVADHVRNMDDETLLALRDNGGVIQIVAYPSYVRAEPPADVSAFVDHIDYAVELIGVDHVGISSDFGGGGGVEGWDDATETMNVTAELVRRQYSEEDIAKLWSGNLLRVWREVEAAATR